MRSSTALAGKPEAFRKSGRRSCSVRWGELVIWTAVPGLIRYNRRAEFEWDFRQLLKGGARGKYAKRYHSGTNLVLLDPDVRRAFRSDRAVNQALRLVIELRKVHTSGQT
jgi:hypothetical protein